MESQVLVFCIFEKFEAVLKLNAMLLSGGAICIGCAFACFWCKRLAFGTTRRRVYGEMPQDRWKPEQDYSGLEGCGVEIYPPSFADICNVFFLFIFFFVILGSLFSLFLTRPTTVSTHSLFFSLFVTQYTCFQDYFWFLVFFSLIDREFYGRFF